MESLREYLNALSTAKQAKFASDCDTSVSYLRKAISLNKALGEGLVMRIEKASGGKVRCEALRPDVDWAYMRRSVPRASSEAAA